MRYLFFAVLFTFQFQIANAKSNQKIEDYFINPQTDLSWMTEKEKLSYHTFLFSLHTFVDAELNKSTAVEYVDKKYAYDFGSRNTKLFEQLLGLEEAHAFGPLALIPWAISGGAIALRAAAPRALAHLSSASTRVSTVTQRVVKNEKFMGYVDEVKDIKQIGVKDAKQLGYVKDVKSVKLPSAATVLTAGSVVVAGVQMATTEDAVDKPAEAVAPVPVKGKVKETAVEFIDIENPRAEGRFCLFGAQASVYKKMGDRFLCTAPQGSVNNSICAESGFKPSFLCQSFGLSASKEKFSVTSELCVGLQAGQGLRDLSARCSTAFIEKFVPKVKALAPAELDKVQRQIISGMNELGAQTGLQGISYLEYCADNNKMNKGQQKTPCNSLMNIMDQFKKESPKLMASLESAGTAKPAGPAQDAKTGSK